MAQDPYKYFRLEARDLLDQFAKGILELEKSGGGSALIHRLLTPGEGAEAPVQSKIASDEGFRTVRVDVAEMDVVLAGVSETHALLNGLRAAAPALEQARHLADILQAQLAPHGAIEQDRHSRDNADGLFSMMEELRRRFGGFERTLGSAIDQMDRELRQLRDSAEQLRLVSAGTLFTALERT